MASQPTPNVTVADVERIVRRDFPEDRTAEVLAMLDEYGAESWQREPERVRLAVLKLAAGSAEQVRCEIDGAKCDYRDVLAFAEYPAYTESVPVSGALPPEEEQRIIDSDWSQYQRWLVE